MATQTGLHVTAPNEPYTIVSSIPVPVPGPKQVLVKSLVTGINPMSVQLLSVSSSPFPRLTDPHSLFPSEPLTQHTGTNVISPWPVVLGCEGSGVVVAVGDEVTRFRVDDGVFGCTRVGQSEYATFQETFLMDEDLAYRRPERLSAEEASTLGVALDVCPHLSWFPS